MALDVLKLIVSLIQALVWPIVVLIALRWFRAPLTALIRRLKSFKGPAGVAGEFAEEAAEIVEELKVTATPEEQERLTELQERASELARRQNTLFFGCTQTIRRLAKLTALVEQAGTQLDPDELVKQLAHMQSALQGAMLMATDKFRRDPEPESD